MPLSKPLVRFLILISLSYALWFVAYEFKLKPNGQLDHFVTEYVTIGICHLLDWSGHTSHYTIALKPGETYIFTAENIFPAVRIGASCNGLELLVLFALFIICYPGKLKFKIPFVAIGIVLIHGLNILRNYWLTLMTMRHSWWYEISHRYLFIFMVYGFIFMLWMYWARNLSRR